MNWKCILLGCKWVNSMEFWNAGEKLVMQDCTRCRACRTVCE